MTEARLRVLVVDDDADVRAVLSAGIIAEPSFELVGTADDAPSAIALAAATHPDVALVDVRMPGGGGVTAARGIGRRSPETKVIALSGQADRVTVLQMLEAGVVGYLLKGGAFEEIVDAIARASKGEGSLSMELTGNIIHELTGQLTVQTRKRRKHEAFERRIQRALHSAETFALVYQPVVGLRDGETVGVEALARFSGRPQRPPDLWFAEAAGVGLRTELELLAVRTAIGALDEVPSHLWVSVNVSPETLARPAFVRLISNADSSRIVVEITEHAPIESYTRLADVLTKLRACGMRLAIDDAGAGYSSLRHILELRPDMIKLDISLIRGIDGDRSKQALAAGLISFAAKSGSAIVAEGIEHQAEREMLIGLGVEFGQGFLLGRPAPLPSPEGRNAPGKARSDKR